MPEQAAQSSVTAKPFTVLEHSIYQSFTKFFTSQLSGIPQMKTPVAPFGVCYDTKKLSYSKIGPQVPNIDLVLQNQNVKWRISGTNSMVEVRPGFDLAKSRLGFSSSLLSRRTSCGNFNFTTTSATP
ncbi:hypothetical protein Patl1_22776 [Pistacia atlantica]|uniref:Uncharacterized protein n=1 Tax=Pistacia atlantica TaxID=434234 RepID=A0ACC0ZX62_9ROSI|nr:hypothetical protein Patl1_22776 [Pistacia atlantica]